MTMWLRKLFDLVTRGPPRRWPASCRLSVEALDDRWVPASLSVGNASVLEAYGGTVAAVVVTLSEPSNKTVTVDYKTANGTALAGYDYQAASDKLTFAPGETSKTILIAVSGDGFIEPDESFSIELSRARHASIADGKGVVTILDDGVDNYFLNYYDGYDDGFYVTDGSDPNGIW
jgi:hypothetical protein